MSDYPYLPTTNADGQPVVPMSDEQKYIFDLKGWICLPALFSEDDLVPIREHMLRMLHDRESVPPHERDPHGGAAQVLLDHPAVVGVLNEILSHQPLAGEECYGFRFDHTYISLRKAGDDRFSPHGGGGLFNFAGNSHFYQHRQGKVHSGLTRVVWEINEVGPGDGGTLLLSGSHKAAFPKPESIQDRNSPLWETYTCPPGSALIFTESLCHSGTRWNNTERDRLSMFTCYDTVNSKWGKGTVAPEVVASWPPQRRTLLRGVWAGMGDGQGKNKYYDEQNHSV